MTYRELIELIKNNANLDDEAVIYTEEYEDYHDIRIGTDGLGNRIYIIAEGY